jgi:hypothetical protein
MVILFELKNVMISFCIDRIEHSMKWMNDQDIFNLLYTEKINSYNLLQCDPYFDQVGCNHPGCEPAYPTPVCEKKCKAQNQVWEEQKHFGVNAYRIKSNPHDIMSEVYTNGPVEVAFDVYEVMSSFLSQVFRALYQCGQYFLFSSSYQGLRGVLL